jgi:hypothetical protein
VETPTLQPDEKKKPGSSYQTIADYESLMRQRNLPASELAKKLSMTQEVAQRLMLSSA